MKNLLVKDRQRALQDLEVLMEVSREPFLVLDTNLKVIETNPSFCQTFRTDAEETKGKYVYDLGNQQWNIPKLKDLLEKILPEKKIFKDFEVDHDFPLIGRRTILLNARQLDSVKLIILAFEDVTEKREAEKKSAEYTKNLESEVTKRTNELSDKIKDLEELTQVMVGRELKMSELKKEIIRIKKLKKLNGNGNNGNGL
jgi:PAS domain S-box-containing protein